MSTLVEDIEELTTKFGFRDEPLTKKKMWFRLSLLEEELNELKTAVYTDNAEEIVDSLIDLTVVALGTLAIANVDIQEAWNEVHRANISKKRGIKPGREASGGFDLIKPEGWKGPEHEGNTGRLETYLAPRSHEGSGGVCWP